MKGEKDTFPISPAQSRKQRTAQITLGFLSLCGVLGTDQKSLTRKRSYPNFA